ncbi:hypothetical protein A3Q56_03403, partial [Intoshia linei]
IDPEKASLGSCKFVFLTYSKKSKISSKTFDRLADLIAKSKVYCKQYTRNMKKSYDKNLKNYRHDFDYTPNHPITSKELFLYKKITSRQNFRREV